MATADFFRRLGFFVDARFLDLEACEQIRAQTITGDAQPGSVYAGTGEFVIDTRIRRVQRAKLFGSPLEELRAKLLSLTPALEAHFQTKLEGVEDPALMTYRVGDFYTVHRDGTDDSDAPEFFRRRHISAIIFLNSEAEEAKEDSYCGGAVVFYGVIRQPGCEKYGIDLNGRAGLLVAFPSDVLHEVEPVTSGERFTIVTWYYR
jgi:SM-20-related protein